MFTLATIETCWKGNAMGSRRDMDREARREDSPLWKALNARGLTLQDIINDMGSTAVNAYEHRVRDYLNSTWFAPLQDLIALKLDSAKALQDEYGKIMSVAGEMRQKALSEILQKEVEKLDREHIIQRMLKAKKIGRHKERYQHRDVITGSWKTVGAKIIEDLGIVQPFDLDVDYFVTAIRASEVKVKKVGGGQVEGWLESRNSKGKVNHVTYRAGYFKVGQGAILPGAMKLLVQINAQGLDSSKKKRLGIEPQSNQLYVVCN